MRGKTLQCYIRFAGLARSGNHVVINWLLSQYSGRICYLNDLRRCGAPSKTNCSHLNALQESKRQPVDLTDPNDKHLLLTSYEGKPLNRLFDRRQIKQYPEQFGHSIGRFFHILLLRDPFNYAASCFKHRENIIKRKGQAPASWEAQRIICSWKKYARTFLKFCASQDPHKIAISYNQWLVSKRYRERICFRLGVSLTDDESRHTVPRYGGGSSFVGQKLQEVSAYLTRWKLYRHDPAMQQILRDPELLDLSDCIFGQTITSSEILTPPATNEAFR